jgi:hypothetical protein
MPTFIDESGDTGPCSNFGSKFFRVAAVWMPSHEHAESFREEIRELRKSLRLSPNYEFKFARTASQPDRRRSFLAIANRFPYRFCAVSIDKSDEYWMKSDRFEIVWASAVTLSAVMWRVYQGGELDRIQSGISVPLNEFVIGLTQLAAMRRI